MKICILFLLLIQVPISFGQPVIPSVQTYTYLSPESDKDIRFQYDKAVLQLALDKTLISHGPFQLITSRQMNKRRSLGAMKTNSIKNFIVKYPISPALLAKYSYVNFPIDLGISSYRSFFVSPKLFSAFNQIIYIEQLKHFTIGLQAGSMESKILKWHGFNIIEGSSYEGLFKMVAKSRIDLFPRGIHHIHTEYEMRISYPYLIPVDKVVLHYNLPQFFFSHKDNTAAIKRLQKGLITAYKDGSLYKLWLQFYASTLLLKENPYIKVFYLENPFLQGVDHSYKQYLLKPFVK